MSKEKVGRPTLTAKELENSFPLIPQRRFGTREGKALVAEIVKALRHGEVRERARKAADETRYHDTVEALIANLAAAYLNTYDPERLVGVGFNNSAYAGTGMQVETMRALRDYLNREGLIELWDGYHRREDERGGAYGRNTRIRSSAKLQHWFDAAGITCRSFALPDSAIIRMKEAPGDLPAVPDDVEASRALLIAINRRLANTDMLILDGGHDLQVDDRADEEEAATLNAFKGDRSACQLYRSFKGGWGLGGRIYGGWWMSESKEARSRIHLDGEETVELDYASLHPRLLFNRAGYALEVDPYMVPGLDFPGARDLGKRTFNRLLNRKQDDPEKRLKLRAGGKKDKKGKVRDNQVLPKGLSFQAYLDRLLGHLHQFQEHFGTGAGMTLQRLDSDIALGVLTRMEAHGVPVLPVHDSFIVPLSARVELAEAMRDSYRDLVGFDPVISG
ncbi:hypothetical protein GTZ99_15765 [Novosphingobium sp. FSY-8]|uniref:DNA-directed DNA polymerase family A palm domain-containing protein n=2 Tax=Novosphingobium ovatum TaxID=1908523 RepID=A0ABW9XHZ6_9SPHN|nr:hypothetical protein [Novosphingobium ovatum]